MESKCRDCPKPATNGVFCEYHRSKYNELTKQVRQERKSKGLCIKCGDKLDPDSITHCTRHRLMARKTLSDQHLSKPLRIIFGQERMDKAKLREKRVELASIARSKGFVTMLTPEEREIYNLRILSGTLSLRDVADRLDKSHEWVRKVENKLAKRLVEIL